MTTRFAGFTAATLAKLGLTSAAAAPDPAAAAPADPENGNDPADPTEEDKEKEAAKKKEDQDMADAEAEAAIADTAVQAAAAGAAAANTRWATVLRAPQAAGNVNLAVDLLADSEMSADKIIATLGRQSKAPEAGASSFDAKMKAEAPNPDVRPDGGQDRAAPTVATRLAAKHAPKKGN